MNDTTFALDGGAEATQWQKRHAKNAEGRKAMATDDRPQKAGKIARTSAGLRDALFDAIERVRDGDMLPADAMAIANTAKQICSTVDLEIKVAKLRTEYPADAKLIVPAPLQLGVTAPKQIEK